MNLEFKIWAINYFIAPFSWSRWTDISIFQYGNSSYLLQGKLNRRSNAKKFRITPTSKTFGAQVIISLERLKTCGLINEEVKFN